MLDALAEALRSLDARCLLLTGTGGMFSAGYDIGNLEGATFSEAAERLVAHPFHAALEALESYPYPVIAAINGHAIGGGLELALTADMRVCASGALLGMPPAKLGLIYSHSGLRRFIDTVGAPRTRELFLLGRYIDAATAQSWGLVNWVVDEDEIEETALAIATQLAANAPLSMAGNKRVLRELLRSDAAIDPELEQELIALREACFASDDLREGVMAFAEKRTPRWTGR